MLLQNSLLFLICKPALVSSDLVQIEERESEYEGAGLAGQHKTAPVEMPLVVRCHCAFLVEISHFHFERVLFHVVYYAGEAKSIC